MMIGAGKENEVNEKQRYQAYLKRLALADLRHCTIEEDFDNVNYERLNDNYRRYSDATQPS